MKKSKQSSASGLAKGILCVVLLALILLNLVVSVVSERVALTWDLTKNQVFALSQQTKDLLDSLDHKISIDVMCDELQLENGGGYFTQTKKIIDQYAIYCPGITVTYRDLAVNPGFAAQYSDFSPEQYDILISSDKNTFKTNIFSLFNSETNGNQQLIRSSKAEQELTSAILRVCSEQTTHAVILTGQEGTYPKALETLLISNGYEVSSQNLSVGELGSDIQLLFLLAPTRDISPEDAVTLQKYLEADGHTLVYAPSVDTPELPNLDALLLQWGVSYDSALIMESNSQRYINSSPYLSIVDYVPGEDAPSYSADVPYLNPFGRKMNQEFETQSGYSTQVLLQYSPKAYAMPLSAEENWRPDNEDFAAYPAVIRSHRTQPDSESFSTLLAFSSAEDLGQTALENVSFSNAEYLLQLLSDACNREEMIHIPAKSITSDRLSITQSQFSTISTVFTLVLPATVLVLGLAMWLHRRKL